MKDKRQWFLFVGYVLDILSIFFVPFWLFTFVGGILLSATYFIFEQEIKRRLIKLKTFFRPVHHHHHHDRPSKPNHAKKLQQEFTEIVEDLMKDDSPDSKK